MRALRAVTKLTVFMRRAVDAVEEALQQRAGRLGLACRSRGRRADVFGILERPDLGALFDEEVEGIVDRHVGDEIDFDLELGDRLGEDEAGQEIAVGVLLHVDEVLARARP